MKALQLYCLFKAKKTTFKFCACSIYLIIEIQEQQNNDGWMNIYLLFINFLVDIITNLQQKRVGDIMKKTSFPCYF